MITLSEQFELYLSDRRSFGFDLSFTERVIRKFTEFADEKGQHHLTTYLFLEWKKVYGNASRNTWATRLSMVRGFASWLVEHDPFSEVPPAGLIAGRYIRAKPYIFSNDEIASILEEAGKLKSIYGLRALLWQTLFGLIAVTGMRVSEALNLQKNDIDFDNNVICVRTGKSGGLRPIPISDCTLDKLGIFSNESERLFGTNEGNFFRKEDGVPAGDCGARYNFAIIGRKIGLRSPTRFRRHGVGPRIHDLRHTFAVNTILEWFKRGVDVDREMYRLSTYLGHADPSNTYWYLEAVPELMDLAAKRAEIKIGGGSK